LRDTLDRLTSLAREDNRDFVPNDRIELYAKLIEILDRLRKLLVTLRRDLASLSPIHIIFRLRERL